MTRRPFALAPVRHVGLVLVVTGMLAALGAAPAAAVTVTSIVVNDYTDPLTNTDDGHCTLREAITAAATDTKSGNTLGECDPGAGTDTIVFSTTVPAFITLGQELAVGSSVAIDGGGNVSISGNDAVRVFNVTAGTLSLANLTLQHGASAGQGGAIYSESGSGLVLDRVTIMSSAAHQGGGIGAQGTLVMRDSTISNNTSTDVGGGLFVNGDSTIERSTISNNTAGSFAGGLETEIGTLTIRDSTFSGNTANGTGGALYSEAGPLSIERSTFTDNAGTSGGAIWSAVATTISSSTLDHNTATQNGGAIFSLQPLTLVNTTIASNHATGRGGGIYREGALTLINATIALNSADDALGGDGVDSGGVADTITTQLRNTVIAGNGTADWGNWAGSILTAGVAANSLVGVPGGTVLADLLDPVGLQANGGPTRTILPSNTTGNPLLGGADTTICTTAPVSAKDQRGFGRTSPCDIGAVELDRTKPVASGAKTSLRRGVAMAGSAMQVRITWSASDVDSGIDHYTVQRSRNGGAWTTIGTPTGKALNTTVTSGNTYVFRVRAVDKEGLASTYVKTPAFTARLVQQSASSVAYRGSWTTTSSTVWSGGSARKSSSAGASVTYTGTGRSFAFVSAVGPGRGKAKVYVDGVYKETIDLGGPKPTLYRMQVWSKTYSGSATHRVKIVVVGTSTRPRVDVDAFAVLK